MNLEVKDLVAKIGPLVVRLRSYVSLICVLAFLAMYGFLVYRIGVLASTEPSEEAFADRLQTVQRPRIDPEAVKRMEALESANVEVRTILDNARRNPFAE